VRKEGADRKTGEGRENKIKGMRKRKEDRE
jgi:hypothetical protein